MKNLITTCLSICFLAFLSFNSFCQVNPSDPQYESMKANGLIEQPALINPVAPVPAILPSDPGTRVLELKVPLDGTFTLAMSANDDGSTGNLTLPFDFCFYGVTENSFYINNNGNVSFGGPYGTYSPTGFPSPAYVMLAPFWGDVDTRSCGDVWYKIEANRVVVIWNQTGYYSNHCGLLNTFELIFTDGTDPLIGVGNNVAFSYTNMQWTTGDASGGSGGFGGYPATVGVNRGNGVDYALVGRFDHPGTDYNGADGISGVGYLEGKYYTFDACGEDIIIIPPDVPISNWALFIGIFLIIAFAVIRFRKLV